VALNMRAMGQEGSRAKRVAGPLGLVVALAAGVVIGACLGGGRVETVHAVSSLADESFAVCTAPLEIGLEGLFILDFQTGDLSGGVLDKNTSKFTRGFRYNVLKDLDFKAGRVKNPRFLLVSGVTDFAGVGSNSLAMSVLYVTDVATGITAAYGIPRTAQQANGVGVDQLIRLDVAKPRGGGAKVP
jgi:hypothetical protein